MNQINLFATSQQVDIKKTTKLKKATSIALASLTLLNPFANLSCKTPKNTVKTTKEIEKVKERKRKQSGQNLSTSNEPSSKIAKKHIENSLGLTTDAYKPNPEIAKYYKEKVAEEELIYETYLNQRNKMDLEFGTNEYSKQAVELEANIKSYNEELKLYKHPIDQEPDNETKAIVIKNIMDKQNISSEEADLFLLELKMKLASDKVELLHTQEKALKIKVQKSSLRMVSGRMLFVIKGKIKLYNLLAKLAHKKINEKPNKNNEYLLLIQERINEATDTKELQEINVKLNEEYTKNVNFIEKTLNSNPEPEKKAADYIVEKSNTVFQILQMKIKLINAIVKRLAENYASD